MPIIKPAVIHRYNKIHQKEEKIQDMEKKESTITIK
jgi:hypothetical protein